MEVLRDRDCTIETPVVRGVRDKKIYGKGIRIQPRVDGRRDTKHLESVYLSQRAEEIMIEHFKVKIEK
jgi:hypothetical protein